MEYCRYDNRLVCDRQDKSGYEPAGIRKRSSKKRKEIKDFSSAKLASKVIFLFNFELLSAYTCNFKRIAKITGVIKI